MTIIVFESRPQWAPQLQHRFRTQDIRVRACRSVSDAAEASESAAVCTLVLQFDAAPADCLRFLGSRVASFPRVPAIVIARRRTMELEWTLRELGAAAVLDDLCPGEELAVLCERQLGSEVRGQESETQADSLLSGTSGITRHESL